MAIARVVSSGFSFVHWVRPRCVAAEQDVAILLLLEEEELIQRWDLSTAEPAVIGYPGLRGVAVRDVRFTYLVDQADRRRLSLVPETNRRPHLGRIGVVQRYSWSESPHVRCVAGAPALHRELGRGRRIASGVWVSGPNRSHPAVCGQSLRPLVERRQSPRLPTLRSPPVATPRSRFDREIRHGDGLQSSSLTQAPT
jgi:hypothetical protein